MEFISQYNVLLYFNCFLSKSPNFPDLLMYLVSCPLSECVESTEGENRSASVKLAKRCSSFK